MAYMILRAFLIFYCLSLVPQIGNVKNSCKIVLMTTAILKHKKLNGLSVENNVGNFR